MARKHQRQATFWQHFGTNGLRNDDGLPRVCRDDAPKDKDETEDTDCNGFSNPNTFRVSDRANRKWEYG